MHEVSLMQNLLEVVTRVAAKEGCDRVRVIHVRIGEMSGINEDSLRFAFDVLSKGTVSESGALEYERVPLMTRCRGCNGEFHPNDLVFSCPVCGGMDCEIVSGREMEVDYILTDDDTGMEQGDACGCNSVE